MKRKPKIGDYVEINKEIFYYWYGFGKIVSFSTYLQMYGIIMINGLEKGNTSYFSTKEFDIVSKDKVMVCNL